MECYIVHFGGETDGAMEEGKKTGEREAHKNVQEAWPYIRVLELLLARERRENE